MRIAIAVEGTRGDVYPMLALAGSFLEAGHAVRLIGPPDFRDVAEARGIEYRCLGRNVQAFLTASAGALHSRGPSFFREMNRWGQESTAAQFQVLPEATAGTDVIFAAGPVLAAASAAELHGVPFRFVVYTPALLPSAVHTPAFFPFQIRSRLGNRLLWRLVRTFVNAMAGREVNRQRARLGLRPVRDLHEHALSARPIVAVDRPLGPVPEDCRIDHQQIRCLHPDRGEPLPEKLEGFLAQGPPPVYLGFGSMTDPDPGQTTLRLLEAIAGLGCRALLSRGWAGLGDGPLPEGVMAIGPVSHASLFPRTAAVVHHGGAGTTHAAARAGVPQIVVPHVLDQFFFARRVADLGVGPPAIPRTQLRVRRLAETLEATLGNEFLGERARELAGRLSELGPVRADPAALLRDL